MQIVKNEQEKKKFPSSILDRNYISAKPLVGKTFRCHQSVGPGSRDGGLNWYAAYLQNQLRKQWPCKKDGRAAQASESVASRRVWVEFMTKKVQWARYLHPQVS